MRDAIGQDYADQRYYSSNNGAFWNPDPGGIRTADPRNPISWNRYMYSLGDPINGFDPTGKIACDPEQDDDVCYVAPDEQAQACAEGYLDACDYGGGGDETAPADPTGVVFSTTVTACANGGDPNNGCGAPDPTDTQGGTASVSSVIAPVPAPPPTPIGPPPPLPYQEPSTGYDPRNILRKMFTGVGNQVTATVCKSSPSARVLASMGSGAVRGALRGGLVGVGWRELELSAACLLEVSWGARMGS